MSHLETLESNKEYFIQMREEKELEFIQALSKTSLWNKDNDSLTNCVKENEEKLEKWIRERDKEKKGREAFESASLSLKKTNKHIKEEISKLYPLYEKIGKLALKSYQKNPTAWEAYKNIFHETLSKIKYFKNTEGKTTELIYSFLHSNFDSYNEKEVKSLKKICVPIGEKVVQLNLLNLLSIESAQEQSLVENIKIEEKLFNNLLKEKRSLESEVNKIQKEFNFSKPIVEFFKNIFSSDKSNPPKKLINSLQKDYHSIVESYKEKVSKEEVTIPHNLENILKEINDINSKIENIDKDIIVNRKEKLLKKNDEEKKKLLSKIESAQKKLETLQKALEENSKNEESLKLEIKENL